MTKTKLIPKYRYRAGDWWTFGQEGLLDYIQGVDYDLYGKIIGYFADPDNLYSDYVMLDVQLYRNDEPTNTCVVEILSKNLWEGATRH